MLLPRPLSIVMFCPQYLPLLGGTERQAEKISRALVHAGCRVKVVTPQLMNESAARETIDGVEVVRFPMADLSKLLPLRGIGVVNLPSLKMQIGLALKPHLKHTDVVHCHGGSLLSAFAVSTASRFGIPTICKIAISQPTELESISNIPLYGREIIKSFIRQNSIWAAISGDIRDELCQFGVNPTQIRWIPNGVEIPAHRQRSQRVWRFLYLGRLSSNIKRDVPTLVAAFERLHTSYKNAELAVVGGGDLLEETRALVSACSARHSISVPGACDPGPWLHWADAFVLPSRREGLSNALLEAMATGMPCVANDIPANREALAEGNAGILTPVGDVETLTHHMTTLIQRPQLAHQMGDAARARAEAVYSIDSVAQHLVTVYRQLAR